MMKMDSGPDRTLRGAPRRGAGVRGLLAAFAASLMGVVIAPLLAETPATIEEKQITSEDLAHWAFAPMRRPAVPNVKDADWARTPIDRFVLARLEAANLRPMPEASRRSLIRRVTYAVTGLPPTPEAVDAFVADAAPDAYERLVERLLASKSFGEHFAQRWLDLARFAETDGFEHDLVRPHAWRYRDWVVNALNADMPYDRFVHLQIAGDQLEPDSADAAVATGFLLAGPDMPDINLQAERRHVFLNDMTATVGSALIGLQLGCAQCHDHKTDPVSQADFYRFRAIFEQIDLFEDHALPTTDDRIADQTRKAKKRYEAELADLNDEIAKLKESKDQDDVKRAKELAKRAGDLKKQIANATPKARIAVEQTGKPRPAHLMIRGDFRRPGPELEPAFLRIVDRVSDSSRAAPSPSRDRRAALARWLTAEDHPLTSRVIANRLWADLFGAGLVTTPSDFGLQTPPPSHPELLDYLATEMIRRGWSLKQMLRLIVTSATYRQASRPAEEGWTADRRRRAAEAWRAAVSADPENRLFSRYPRKRLTGEAIRDAMLQTTGWINPDTGGPGVRPPLPEEIRATLLRNQWNVSKDPADHHRRSIYLFVRRNLRFPLLEAFDRPDAHDSCARRVRSTTAPQALIMLNSEFSLLCAQRLAGRVLAESPNDLRAAVTELYRLLYSRAPRAEEWNTAEQFLTAQAGALNARKVDPQNLALPTPMPKAVDPRLGAALTDFCLALFNANEFIYLD